MVVDWTFLFDIPKQSRVVKTASPVESDGSDIPGSTTYSSLTRIDYQGGSGSGEIPEVDIDYKTNLKSGDRVLVVPVNKGQDFCVIARVVPN